jgi:pSer/pThr/pTyr-binding forkhead associated (FHA) protein
VPTATGGVVGVLIAVDGQPKDEVYRLYDGENPLGRSEHGKVVLTVSDRSISREHALIIHQDGSFGVRALKAEDNPTYVNGEKIEGAMLSDGDTLTLGSVTFKFRTV